MPTATDTITIPWDGGTKEFVRDHLATAYLHYLLVIEDGWHPVSAVRYVYQRLRRHEEIPSYTTSTLAVAARIVHEHDIKL